MNLCRTLVTVAFMAATATVACADRIKNSSFEGDFESKDDIYHWGNYGELFGNVAQVEAGGEVHPAKAKAGGRMIVIDVPANSWNGIWQQVDGRPNQPFVWKASCFIKGDLPDSVATFLKVEFFDEAGEHIAAVEGEWFRNDTKGQWVESTVKGSTPAGTKEVRFVIIAGDNSEGAEVKNRIYWDDASAQ